MPPDGLPTYAVVSPVRDEAEHFARTAEAMLDQTHRPQEWIVVDDGSTDGTRELAQRYADAHQWITVIDSGSVHERARGAPIVQAFERGRSHLRERPDITVKLDGDLFLPCHYFAWVARVFADDPRAGIVGGVALVHDGERWVSDIGKKAAVNGVAKAYRTAFLDEIGGLPASMGWDGIDEYSARARSWRVHVLTELSLLHYRRRGSKQLWWRGRWEEGRGSHYMGYSWAFLAVHVAYRMLAERPRFLGGLVLGAGFLFGRLTGAPQIPDDAARRLLRSDQHARLRDLAKGRSRMASTPSPGGGPAFTATGEPIRADRTGAGLISRG